MRVLVDGLTLTLPGDHRALAGLSLTVEHGERVAIIGPSGAGKTSLLRVIASSIRPTSGTVQLDGADPWGLSRGALRHLRARIGLIHQSPPLPPRQRVVTAVLAGRLGVWPLWKSLASLLYPLDIPGVRDTLTRLDVADRLFDRCGRLSGGQLQRVGVARVLYQRPQLMLADEPVAALDPQLADRVIGELNREATVRGVTLVASLHAVDLALTWFPRIVGIRNGTIAFDLPRARVTTSLLTDLYASESPVPPTQDNRLIELPERGVKPHPIYR